MSQYRGSSIRHWNRVAPVLSSVSLIGAVDRMLAGELRNGHGQWRFPNSVKALPKLERAIFKLSIGGNKLAEAGSPMGAVTVGPADLLMLKLVSSEKGDCVRLEARPNGDGAERAAYHLTRRPRIGYCVFCRDCSPVIGVSLQVAGPTVIDRGNV